MSTNTRNSYGSSAASGLSNIMVEIMAKYIQNGLKTKYKHCSATRAISVFFLSNVSPPRC